MSGDQTGDTYDLHAVMDGEDDGGVPHGRILSDFADGICRNDPARTAEARTAVVEAIGEAAMVDAAAVIAAFNAYPRAADATGIPLEDMKVDMTADLREELGLEAFNVGK